MNPIETPPRLSIPIPSPNPYQVTPREQYFALEGAPHHYKTEPRSWIGKVSEGVTARAVFEALRYHATPLQDGRIPDGGKVTDIPVLGKVKHIVFPETLTIVNTTLPDHRLHPGNVFRRVVQEGDDICIETEGYGTGLFAKWNEDLAEQLWPAVDQSIRRWVNTSVPASHRENFSTANAAEIREAGDDVGKAIRANQVDAANAARVRNGMAPPAAAMFFPTLPAIGPLPFLPRAFLPGALGTTPAAD